jgi:hypothetical protein
MKERTVDLEFDFLRSELNTQDARSASYDALHRKSILTGVNPISENPKPG